MSLFKQVLIKRTLTALLVCAMLPAGLTTALAQPTGLPSLGAASAADLSPAWERRLGESIIAQGRIDPTYVHDPDINQYLNNMGQRLVRYAPVSSTSIDLFGVKDPVINAFALPGGFIGINTGLMVAATTESELAGVVAHEIAHVTQRHIARGFTQQKQSGHIAMASIAAALLAAVAGSANLGAGVAAFGQAAAVDGQLGFSRDAEREADRVGFLMLSKSGYNPEGMQNLFERLMQASQFNERGGGGAYMSTHPMSIDRMTDMQNRTQTLAKSTYRDSDAFWYTRARARVLQADDRLFLKRVQEQLQDEARRLTGVQRSSAFLGLALVELRQNNVPAAQDFYQKAQAGMVASPYLARVEVELALTAGQPERALAFSDESMKRWPDQQSLANLHAQALQQLGRYAQAAKFLEIQLKRWPTQDPGLYQALANNLAQIGEAIRARQSMATYYTLTGAFPAAMAQLQQARQISKDFHQQSQIDVQIRQLTQKMANEREVLQRFSG
jgi:predicted Zn-dependent protease